MRNVLLVLITLGMLVSGCVVINNADDSTRGQKIQEATLKQFEPGTTTKAWTLAVLGEPTSQENLDGGIDVLRYEYSHRSEQQTLVFLLFAGNADKEEKQTVYLEFKDDVLTRYWQEQD